MELVLATIRPNEVVYGNMLVTSLLSSLQGSLPPSPYQTLSASTATMLISRPKCVPDKAKVLSANEPKRPGL